MCSHVQSARPQTFPTLRGGPAPYLEALVAALSLLVIGQVQVAEEDVAAASLAHEWAHMVKREGLEEPHDESARRLYAR